MDEGAKKIFWKNTEALFLSAFWQNCGAFRHKLICHTGVHSTGVSDLQK